MKPEAKLLATEIANAWAYALDVTAFKLPKLENGMLTTSDTDTLADAEIAYSRAALLYARQARGGRIPEPTAMLTTELDTAAAMDRTENGNRSPCRDARARTPICAALNRNIHSSRSCGSFT